MMKKGPIFKGMMAVFLVLMICEFSFAGANPEKGFKKLIQRYGAYEALAAEFSNNKGSPSPGVLLELAQIQLRLGKANQVIKMLRYKKFSGIYEGRRLLLLGDAYRMELDFKDSLIYYARARDYLTTKQMMLTPALASFWEGAIRRWIWDYIYGAQYLVDKEEISSLENVVLTGRLLWNRSHLWEVCVGVCSLLSRERLTVPVPTSAPIRDVLIRFFARISLQDYKTAQELASSLPKKYQTQSLFYLLSLIKGEGNAPSLQKTYPKLDALVEILPSLLSEIKGKEGGINWSICVPAKEGIRAFQHRLLSLSPTLALSLLKRELNSPLISPFQKRFIEKFRISYLLLVGDYNEVKRLLSPTLLSSLPLSLKISLLLMPDPPMITSPSMRDAWRCALIVLQPFDVSLYGITAPFDTPYSEVEKRIKDYPLDMLLYYAYLKRELLTNKTTRYSCLKYLAMLYPSTPAGKQSLLSLAQLELDRGDVIRAQSYIGMFTFEHLTPALVTKYYLLMARLLDKKGDREGALSYYEKLLEFSPNQVPPMNFLKIALYAQQTQRWKVAQNFLLYLWHHKKRLSRAMQAEILFWLAEGDEQLGKEDLAIDRYLKVYWYYKDQYIWSITALYRAGLIYERKGNLIVARNIFRDVLRDARRKSEREAARARLKAIEQQKRGYTTSPYLF